MLVGSELGAEVWKKFDDYKVGDFVPFTPYYVNKKDGSKTGLLGNWAYQEDFIQGGNLVSLQDVKGDTTVKIPLEEVESIEFPGTDPYHRLERPHSV